MAQTHSATSRPARRKPITDGPAVRLGAAMNGGHPNRQRQEHDWYPTPRNVTQSLFTGWRPKSRYVWEPACGDGSMAVEVEQHGYKVIGTDLVSRGYGQGGIDFLKTTERQADCVITNPPFMIAPQFIEHAFDLGVQEMAMLLKSTFWHAARRYPLFLRHRPSIIMPLLWRPDFLNLGAPALECMWCVWEPGVTETKYIPLARP